MLQEQVLEEREPDLEEEEEDIIILDNREEHWRDVTEDTYEYRIKVHAMRCEVYMKYMM